MVLTLTPQPIPLKSDPKGIIRVGGTRVSLESVIHAYQGGASPEEIVQRFPTLALADIHLVLGYYLLNRETVDLYLEQQNEEAKRMKAIIEAKFGTQEALYQKLVTRQAGGVNAVDATCTD